MAQYIDKSALVAEIRNKVDSYKGDGIISIGVLKQYCEDFIYSLDTLEVKEVDLEKEIKEEYINRRLYGGRNNMLVILNEPQFNEVAKHFFELGLKAQKGEAV